MNENATRLRETMRAARMSRRETAAALHVSTRTISAWLLPKTRANLSPCPAWAPELLALKAAARARNARAGSVPAPSPCAPLGRSRALSS
jgi:transcriptional regulator with XRE-family HTH domain